MANHVSDFTQEEDKIVLDLINYDNESTLNLQQVSLSSLRVTEDGETALTVVPKVGSGYKDEVEVFYRRLPLQPFSDLYAPEGLIFPQGDAQDVVDFLDEINAALGLAIDQASVLPMSIGSWDGHDANSTKQLSLQLKTTHRVYVGDLIVTIKRNDIPLEEVVSKNVLSGLNLPELS